MKRFWDKVEKTDGCWIWRASKTNNGYGRFQIKKQTKVSHRISWELTNGEIPDGLLVLHHCDNPACVRPDHLFLGTHVDNSKDMVQKGRVARGVRHHKAKLTEEQIKEIRLKHSNHQIPQKQIADEYGVGQPQISRILSRTHWKI